MKSKMKDLILVFVLALLIRSLILYFQHDDFLAANMSPQHAEPTRHVNGGEGLLLNPAFIESINKEQTKQSKLIDLQEFESPKNESLIPLGALISPGYVLFMSPIFLIVGERYIYVQIIQIVFDSFCVLLIYKLTMRLLKNDSAALLSAGLYAIYLPIAKLSTLAIPDALMPFFVVSASYFFLLAISEKNKTKNFIFSAILFGIASYFKTSILSVAIFLCAYYLFDKRRAAIKSSLVFILIIFLLLIPWSLYRYNLTGEISLTPRSGFAIRMWYGIGEYENKWGAVANDEVNYRLILTDMFNYARDSPETNENLIENILIVTTSKVYDEFWFGKVFSAIKEEPLWYAYSVIARVPFVVFSIPRPNNPYFLQLAVVNIPLLILAVFGFFMSGGKQKTVYLVLIALSYISVSSFMHVDLRDILPGIFPYFIFASVALSNFKSKYLS